MNEEIRNEWLIELLSMVEEMNRKADTDGERTICIEISKCIRGNVRFEDE